MNRTPLVSIVIPVYNGRDTLPTCLQSIGESTFTDWELIVVDDGSTDGSAALARASGAAVLHTGGRHGPAAARNLGAARARGDWLFFTDADCALHADTLALATAVVAADVTLTAVIGSYDDAPAAPNFASQYKNLFHHYTHQTSREEAQTFWTGCGLIRRERFLALGGFDAVRYPTPSIEDIELGYRLTAQGGRIRLAKQVQVTHLKRWTLWSLVRTDIGQRARPWSILLCERGSLPADLNLRWRDRLSVLTLGGALLGGGSLLRRRDLRVAFGLLPVLVGLLLWLNRDLYRFFWRKRNGRFALFAILLHWFYLAYSAATYGVTVLSHFCIDNELI